MLLGILSYLIKIFVVSSTSYISLSISLIYLLLTYTVWLDAIRWGNISFNRVANAFEIIFRSAFNKDIGFQFLINLLSVFFSINFIIACFWEVLSSLIEASLIDVSHGKILYKTLLIIHHYQVFCYFPLTWRFTNADLKISVYILNHMKIIHWTCRLLIVRILELFIRKVCNFLKK